MFIPDTKVLPAQDPSVNIKSRLGKILEWYLENAGTFPAH
jgi:hypothetical protein